MFDPIGGFDRMIDQFLAYLDTAYRIDDVNVSQARRDLLSDPKQLALDPIFEVVPRYETSENGLEALLEDKDGILHGFSPQERNAFVQLALSGLFDRDDTTPELKGAYPPYDHQLKMLKRGVRDGQPGIVTSGTGSGKTESFLLPILAQLAKEACSWPRPHMPYDDDWLNDKGRFRLYRRNESPIRPQAVRALVLYPLNALVEDQMVRLRKAIDSPAAHEVMEKNFNGNRLFFGRYTGKSPVTGYRKHPRRQDSEYWTKRTRRARSELKAEMRRYRSIQERIALDVVGGGKAKDKDLRYVFPSTNGSELISRWDIQETPPDILVTNQSILNAMLVREVDEPIITATREWIINHDDARFYLVLDELHLIRGSAGAEMAGLLRILLDRLSLTQPEHAHKLRILSSSASLPMEGDVAEDSIRYLKNMFGSAGIAGAADQDQAWRDAVVTGRPIPVSPPSREPSVGALRELAGALDLVDRRKSPREFLDAFLKCARTIDGGAALSDGAALLQATRTAAEMLDFALKDDERTDGKIPRSVAQIGAVLFGREDREAVRGLLALRAIPDLPDEILPENLRPERKDISSLPGFRMHCFVRNIEGMFSSIGADEDGKAVWGKPSIERGQDYEAAGDGMRKRMFEMLYCEACGDLYIGGKRGDPNSETGIDGKRIALLPAPQELEKLPESAASLRFEDASFDDYALFWPRRWDPETEIRDGTPFRWVEGFLNPVTGIITETQAEGDVPGRLLMWSADDKFHARKRDENGTAVPYCCAKCGTDYSGRYSSKNSTQREGRLSPVRSFRTGFGKTSQLLATELVASLKSQGGDGKLVAFSDSREDAANLALEVEVQHQRDLRREILISAATKISREYTYTAAHEAEYDALKAELLRLVEVGEDTRDVSAAMTALRRRKAASSFPASVPLDELFEFQRNIPQKDVRPILSSLMSIGSTPVEGADTRKTRVGGRPWYRFFDKTSDGDVNWKVDVPLEVMNEIDWARKRIQKGQPPEATDLLFSKTYFALEETGLGWPSFFPPGEEYSSEKSRDDAMLRIFADAYRIVPNLFQQNIRVDWRSGHDMIGRGDSRLAKLLKKILQNPKEECDAFLDRLHHALKQARGNGSIDISRLYFRAADPKAAAWRCHRCGRVHLHEGFSYCTRCGDKLTRAAALVAEEITKGNFLGRRVMRSVNNGEELFRLKCEELTGQTQDPAERLQQFKEVFVKRDDESPEDFEWRKLFDSADLLSVTTTMEVGVDIGSLQAVYQGNMPPQRFNYQQRVGRAGRRGQAFSTVLTVCRSKSHDIHYFHNPIEITGAAPPPPFITTKLVDIPSRLLRKFWLVKAFKLLRMESGDDWAGDNVIPGDIHGEFLYCNEYFDASKNWRDRLEDALDRVNDDRLQMAAMLADVSRCAVNEILDSVTVDNVIQDIEELREEFSDLRTGLAAALAERGLVPLYGMPTRSRSLYIELTEKKGSGAAEWDAVSRDQDMAIFDFAPGSVRTREKLRHRCIGFTGTLRDPDEHLTDFGVPMDPHNDWCKQDFHLRFCEACGAWNRVSAEADRCRFCETEFVEAGIRCIVPTAYRTEFRPTNENLRSRVGQRITLASLGTPDRKVNSENLNVNFAERAEIYLVNPGFREESDFSGFTVEPAVDMTAQKIDWFKTFKPMVKLAGQAIASDVLEEDDAARYRVNGDEVSAWLASPKVTNSLQIGPVRVNSNLRLLDMDVGLFTRNPRAPWRTSVRAAAVSATEILVQRAAFDLDIAPEEFDALSPNIMNYEGRPLPYLQISDALPNGSGFCRHLLGERQIPVAELLRSIVEDPNRWPRNTVAEGDHRVTCGSSCYRCLQRYNNRNFHGLLDWRLGLSYLRALMDPAYECGFDRNYTYFELEDWSANAWILANETQTFIPGNAVASATGRPDIPVFSLDAKQSRWGVVVHPLWNREALFQSLKLDHRFTAVDSFELARRPLHVIERLRAGKQ
ncbi:MULTISPECIES: DEAD/DEAH box helicase [unclassified Rhizobium]|uniref:DEAD/DEAH box helicase n=1 Tax=unclassified Rhizobium TaxID=2613769 RepID=UPI001ADBB956|nr:MULTISPECIES: DEAD/DEAH box helicase [unclassified Rhizobium]MBO9127949.1 DEAD/DEAH box helicase [Rhizobium sp. 16-488-2b]MBO9178526.1 DEAD/DEAH box helicase [Rhizobium sp. 16-488-2a]